jgi:hypothetical protein
VLPKPLEMHDAAFLDVITVVEGQADAKAEAERSRPGLTIFTDGSRTDCGAVGYAVVWRKG